MHTSGIPVKFDWKEYLAVAKRLLAEYETQPNKEANLRTAVSRAYYASFKTAEEFLLRKNEISPIDEDDDEEQRIGSHWRVIRAFAYSRNRHRKQIGEALIRMRFDRESADYHAEFRGNLLDAVNDVIDQAQYVINALKVAV
jgi:uncharacterized protein (UPF0332 family)